MALGEVSREEFRQSVYRLAQLRQQLVDELARREKAKDEHKNTIAALEHAITEVWRAIRQAQLWPASGGAAEPC